MRLGASAATRWAVLAAALALGGCDQTDHRARAELVDAMSGAHEVRLIVNQLYAESGRFPDAAAVAQYRPRQNHRYRIQTVAENRQVVLTFTEEATRSLRGRTLRFTLLQNSESGFEWRCSSDDVQPVNLPANCRQP